MAACPVLNAARSPKVAAVARAIQVILSASASMKSARWAWVHSSGRAHRCSTAPSAAAYARAARYRQRRARPGTQQRVEVLKDRGYAVTDIVDAALNEFLDRAGCPRPSSLPPESGQRFPPGFLVLARCARWVVAVQARP